MFAESYHFVCLTETVPGLRTSGMLNVNFFMRVLPIQEAVLFANENILRGSVLNLFALNAAGTCPGT